jgi:hypothetical protein
MGFAAALATIECLLSLQTGVLVGARVAIALVLWGLFAWSFRGALSACVGAAAVYMAWWLSQVVLSPLAAFQGILVRVLIVSALLGGVGAEWNMRRRSRAVTSSRRHGGGAG